MPPMVSSSIYDKVNIIPAENIGGVDVEGNTIILDDIMNETPIELSNNAYGVRIPHDELLARHKYKYFAYILL